MSKARDFFPEELPELIAERHAHCGYDDHEWMSTPGGPMYGGIDGTWLKDEHG
jgi:hypothetical protein